ncbi:DDRGK domain-containing protein 1-like [Procambarus clarkii]|uniref:DDRGK domain-containing protein 1-like n=1 Tax=Procambarus clarkii TaxID=6728 RepID=UPI0037434072
MSDKTDKITSEKEEGMREDGREDGDVVMKTEEEEENLVEKKDNLHKTLLLVRSNPSGKRAPLRAKEEQEDVKDFRQRERETDDKEEIRKVKKPQQNEEAKTDEEKYENKYNKEKEEENRYR